MENVFIISLLCTFFFCLAKLIEVKFMQKDTENQEDASSSSSDEDNRRSSSSSKPLKYLLRDALIVFAANVVSTYLYMHVDGNVTDILHILTETKTAPVKGASEIFTGAPGF